MKRRVKVLVMGIILILSISVNSMVFANDAKFSRGSFCMKIVELLDLKTDISDMKTLYDVKADDKYYESIMIMCKLGYMNPYENGTFKPDSGITRAEVARILTTMLYSEDFEVPDNAEYDLDYNSSKWYAKYAWKAKSCGLMNSENNLFKGDNTATEKDINYEVLKNNVVISVLVDGKRISFDVEPQIINGRTMVPIRGIFESLGAQVMWDGDTQTAIATKDQTTVKITINDTSFEKNGKKIGLDVPAQIINGRTLVPVRAIGESFECTVDWDGTGIVKKVIIKSPKYIEKEKEEIEESKKLACVTSVSKSAVSVGGNYRIAFSVSVEGKGGEGNYKYRYELYQNGKISKKCSYSKENTFEGNLTGTGNCILKVYVKDNAGTEVSKDIDLTE